MLTMIHWFTPWNRDHRGLVLGKLLKSSTCGSPLAAWRLWENGKVSCYGHVSLITLLVYSWKKRWRITIRSELVERIVERNPKNIGLNTSCLPCIFLVYSSPKNLGKKKHHEELHHSSSYAIPDFASKSYAAMLPRHSSWKKKGSFKNICEESGIWCHFWSNDESFTSKTEDLESLKRQTHLDSLPFWPVWQIFDFHGSSWIREPSFPCFPNRDNRDQSVSASFFISCRIVHMISVGMQAKLTVGHSHHHHHQTW